MWSFFHAHTISFFQFRGRRCHGHRSAERPRAPSQSVPSHSQPVVPALCKSPLWLADHSGISTPLASGSAQPPVQRFLKSLGVFLSQCAVTMATGCGTLGRDRERVYHIYARDGITGALLETWPPLQSTGPASANGLSSGSRTQNPCVLAWRFVAADGSFCLLALGGFRVLFFFGYTSNKSAVNLPRPSRQQDQLATHDPCTSGQCDGTPALLLH